MIMCTSNSAGTLASVVSRSLPNSVLRWRRCSSPITLPVVASRADKQLRSKGLDLALFIDTQHERAVGRVQIEPDQVAHFVDKSRTTGRVGVSATGETRVRQELSEATERVGGTQLL